MRVVTSSVFVDGGEMPLASVKTRGTVPKAKIGEVLGALTLGAPDRAGRHRRRGGEKRRRHRGGRGGHPAG